MGRVTRRKADFHRRVADIVDRFQLRRARNEVATTAETFATDADVAAIAAFAATLGTAAALDIDTDDTFAADSDDLIPTQAAVGGYVANQAAALFGYTQRAFCALLGTPWIAGVSGTQKTAGAVTTEEVLDSVLIPGGTLLTRGQVHVFALFGNDIATANNKVFRIRVHTSAAAGGTVIQSATNTNVNRFWHGVAIISNQNAMNSQRYRSGTVFAGSGTASNATASFDSTNDLYVVLTAQKANSGDVATLDQFSVMVLPFA